MLLIRQVYPLRYVRAKCSMGASVGNEFETALPKGITMLGLPLYCYFRLRLVFRALLWREERKFENSEEAKYVIFRKSEK